MRLADYDAREVDYEGSTVDFSNPDGPYEWFVWIIKAVFVIGVAIPTLIAGDWLIRKIQKLKMWFGVGSR